MQKIIHLIDKENKTKLKKIKKQYLLRLSNKQLTNFFCFND